MANLATTPAAVDQDEQKVIAEFLVGYGVLWVVLVAGSEFETTRDLSAAFALTLAVGATVLLLVDAAQNLGLDTKRTTLA